MTMTIVRSLATTAVHRAVSSPKRLTRLLNPSPDTAIECMRADGAVEKTIPISSIQETLSHAKGLLEQGYGRYKEGNFFEDRTSRATGLLRLSYSYAHDQVGHPPLRKIADHFLTTRHEERMPSGEPYLWKTPPQDDSIYHNRLSPVHKWTEPRDLARDSSLSMFVAGSESTVENGATRLIPGSHLLGSEDEPDEGDAVHAELQPGHALLMLYSVYHGGGANTTSDKTRIVFATSIIRGILRQEENQFLAVPLETMKNYPEDVQRFAGFLQQFPKLGWVNHFQDPT